MSLPKTYKQAAFKTLGGGLTIEEVPLVMPEPDQILVKVEASGVCHSDVFVQHNLWGAGFPMVPGHEIVGRVAALGDGVVGWKIGDRVGGGWHGGHDGTCENCRDGFYQFCQPYIVNGVTRNGGYAEYCTLRAQAAIRVPEDIDPVTFAPILCAGLTTFGALQAAALQPGDTVAVQGLGGLGHMAVQFARKLGLRVIAISRGSSKEKWIRELGAHEYIDSSAGDPGEALQKLGYAKVVLTTVLSTAVMAPLIKGIAIYGKMMILSFPEQSDITLSTHDMMMRGITVQAHTVGHARENEKTAKFAHMQGITCAVEAFPLERAQEAYDAMINGTVRFRSVLKIV
ncbi:alcohol dehydrogenase GroES-like domain-containing protein [Thozetella sp. PMI_491]|nr:alcohol dehydrogenase GroES-like domain-containing protein [Thozetella sp. PMI_491]